MIHKAADDFRVRTLAALPTLLDKLAYICSLQTADGAYAHWGLTRVYGQQEAQDALNIVHAETAVSLARMPLREIYQEFVEGQVRPMSASGINPESFVLTAPTTDDGL